MIPLLKIQKFLQLAAEHTYRYVVSMKGSTKLAPSDAVINK
jgi:hypothetical protein